MKKPYPVSLKFCKALALEHNYEHAATISNSLTRS
jgi:hypothetical protein